MKISYHVYLLMSSIILRFPVFFLIFIALSINNFAVMTIFS